MKNRAMLRMIMRGDCVDVSECQRTPEGYYIIPLKMWIDHKEHTWLDGVEEEWIYSIGRRKNDGVILASKTTEFYEHVDFDCLWLK